MANFSHRLRADWVTVENFRPYGQIIQAAQDGKPFDAEDAQLQLQNGTPRFYIMRLHQRGRICDRLTRHVRSTQCLGALEGKDWLIAVAPPKSIRALEGDRPNLEDLQAFRIPGNCCIKLDVGTWHAGPYFDVDFIDFYNLELSDTNITDHETCDLSKTYDRTFEIV